MAIIVYDTKDCDTIRIKFNLFNTQGLIPLITRVYLDNDSGPMSSKPIFTSNELSTDASIELTKPFKHHKGLMFFETFLSYDMFPDLKKEQIVEMAENLELNYEILNCVNESEGYEGPENINIVESKKWIYLTKTFDLI